MTGMYPGLYRENMVVLMVLQAISGVLTCAVTAMSLEFLAEEVVLAHFLLREPSPEDEAEIYENLATEVSVFTNGLPDVGEVVLRPDIAFVADHPAGYLPPGRLVIHFRG
jgi:hypothetical protein